MHHASDFSPGSVRERCQLNGLHHSRLTKRLAFCLVALAGLAYQGRLHVPCDTPIYHTRAVAASGAPLTDTPACPSLIQWFTKAGFTDVKITRIGPKWYRGVRRHGLIMGCSVTGVKPKVGAWVKAGVG